MIVPGAFEPDWISPEEYLQREARAEERHEYVDGVVRPLHEPDPNTGMAGSSRAHIQIVSNIVFRFREALRDGRYQTFGSDAKIRLTDSSRYYYPDATIACDPFWSSETDGVLDNPTVIFEVLSPGTHRTDKAEKLDVYLSLAIVRAIVFISSTIWRVEVYERQDAARWLYRMQDAPDAVLELSDLGSGAADEPLRRSHAVIDPSLNRFSRRRRRA